MAQVIEKQGYQAAQDKIGVDATGMRFNSIVAVEKVVAPEKAMYTMPVMVQTIV
jgi:glutaminase